MPVSISAKALRACLSAMLLLAACGCNLNFTPEGAAARFEGPPQIVIAAPLPNQTYLAGATVIVQARIENAGADLARVAVLLDEALLGEKLSPNETGADILPLSIDWPTSNPGSHQLSVMAERADGTAARADVSIRVITPGNGELPPAPTETAPVAETGESDSAAQSPAAPPDWYVEASVIQPSNLRRGPGTLHEPIGNLPENAPIVIVAVSPGRDWYRVQHEGEDEAWLYSESVSEVDISGLPAETGPPPPLPNLIVENLRLDPEAPVCGQELTVRATIRNIGDYRARTLGLPLVEALRADNDEALSAQPITVMQGLDAGERYDLDASLTLSQPLGQDLIIRVTVGGIQVAETDTSDNSASSPPFTLAQGDCS